MCGIYGIVNDRSGNPAQTVLDGLKKLEYRGYDSWGIAIIPTGGNEIKVEKHVGKIGDAKIHLPQGAIAFGHTRWATHGGVTDANAHPHLDCRRKIAVIHNGIVENYQELKNALVKKGHKFVSETDTEVIAHQIEETVKTLPGSENAVKSFQIAVFKTFKELNGSNAIAVLDLEDKSIICCRNGSPLVVGTGDGEYFMASDVPAFLAKTNRVHFLADGEAAVLSKKGIELFSLSTLKPVRFSPKKIDWKMEDAEKSGYPHFLLKEIVEQKKTIPKTATINKEEILASAKEVRKNKKLVIVGCGSAAYCGLAAKYFFAKSGIETQVYGAYEFLPFAKFCDSKTTVVAISQSGETADTIIAAQEARKNGAKVVALVNARGSTLERMAQAVIAVGAGPEIAVVSTKAFTAQLATLYLLAAATANKYEEGVKNIKKLGETLQKWNNSMTQRSILDLAREIMNHEDMYLIGKHLNYPAALEFALKIKETSYIHAEPFAAGELKHGVITLIQNGTVCFVLAANDEVRDEILSSAAQLKARGGMLIGITPFKSPLFDKHIETADCGDLTIFVNIMVGQFLGYFLGVGRGCDPDKPRNLAKSVTVK